MNDKALRNLSYGLFVVTSSLDGRDNGCITNTLIQAGSDPLSLALAVNKTNYTHDMIEKSGILTASVISEDADFELFKHFGFQSGRDVDKFADFTDVRRTANGALAIEKGTNAFFSCKVTDTKDLGSHTLFICSAADMDIISDVPSATYTYYQSNIKPKPEQTVSTGKTIWRCTVCGYEYEGEELPADFVCPLCGHPASDFEKVEG